MVEEVYSKGYAAQSYQERQKFLDDGYRRRNNLVPKFLDLAEKYPKDVVALDALLWVVSNTQLAGKDSPGSRATAMLQRDHVHSDKLGPICHRIAHAIDENYETFLRKVLEINPHREVQGMACVSLAFFLNNRLEMLDLLKGGPEFTKHFEALSSKDYLEQLQRQDRAEVTKEAEALFEKAVTQYGDVEIPNEGTVGEKAKSELFELRHLAVGKEAPDIEGADQDAKRFKLSDYRGKVVLLDFWSQF